jgi:hypothetical protein
MPNSIESAKGHLDRTKQPEGLNSTSNSPLQSTSGVELLKETEDDFFRTDLVSNSGILFTRLIPLSQFNDSDATGRFPVQSRTGSAYILVSVLDNYIHLEPLQGRSSSSYATAFTKVFAFFRSKRRLFKVQRMDNEISTSVEALTRKHWRYRICTPHNHRTLKSERAIRTAKNHIIAMQASCDPRFPLDIWDSIIPQAELTLNHLRSYHPNTSLSAWDFVAHPIAPFGTAVLIYESPDKRASWASHGVEGFYIGPATDQYRSFVTWAAHTRSQRISDTLAWFPQRFRMPDSSTQEHLIAALNDLSTGLAKVANSNSILTANKPLFDSVSESAMSSLKTLTDMFSSATHSAGKLSLTGSHSDSDCQHSRVVSAKDVNSNSILTTNNPSFDSVSESAMSTLKTLPEMPSPDSHSAIVIATASIRGW